MPSAIFDKHRREASLAGLELVGPDPDPRRRMYRYSCGHEISLPTYRVRIGKVPRCSCDGMGGFPKLDPADVAEAHFMVLSPDYKVVQAGWFRVAELMAVGKNIEPRSKLSEWREANGLGWMRPDQVKACREIDYFGVTLEEVKSSYFSHPKSLVSYAVTRDIVKYPGWLVNPPKPKPYFDESAMAVRYW